MNYSSIRIEGAILSPDILERLEDAPGQRPADFGLDASVKVKDEIARAWVKASLQCILELRRLHRELDTSIRDAYGWQDFDLSHDFIEVETLPENDRVRYTVSPAARKEVLKRLLALNHKHAAEQATTAPIKTNKRGRKFKVNPTQGGLFV